MLYLTNNNVAWEIPHHLRFIYEEKYYIPPKDWHLKRRLLKRKYWRLGNCGEWRKIKKEVEQ